MSTKPSGIPWIGSVPGHWEVVEPRRIFALRRMGELSSDVHLTPSQKYGVLPQSEYMEITGNRVVQNLSGNTLQHVEAGDFISHLRTFQGGLELARVPGKVSPAYTVVAPRSPAHSEYYKYVLKSAGYISQIASVTDQLRDGQSMRYSEFNHTWLPLPPLDEQQIIADYLDHETAEIDSLIDDLNKTQKLLEERRFGSLGQAIRFPEGIHLGVGAANHLVQIKHLAEITLGKMLDTKSLKSGDSTHPYLRAANVQPAGRLALGDLKSMRFTERERQQLTLLAGDVVVVEGGVGGYGRAAFVSDDLRNVGFQNSIIRLRPHNGVDGRYLTYALLLLRSRGYIETVASVSSMPHYTVEKVATTPVPSIGSEDQQRISNELDQLWTSTDDMMVDAEKALVFAQERRAALISAAVTGQIDVTGRRRGPSEAEWLESELARTQ